MQKFIVLTSILFVTSCAQNTPLLTTKNCPCDLIFGHDSDWDVISDDLARNIYRHNKMCEKI